MVGYDICGGSLGDNRQTDRQRRRAPQGVVERRRIIHTQQMMGCFEGQSFRTEPFVKPPRSPPPPILYSDPARGGGGEVQPRAAGEKK